MRVVSKDIKSVGSFLLITGCIMTGYLFPGEVCRAEKTHFPCTLQDAAGRTVTLEKRPVRLVITGKGPHMIQHLLYMFPEAPSRLAGYENRSASVNKFLNLIDPEVNRKTQLGLHPGPEEIAALKPDVVIMKGNREDKIGTALSDFGIPVLYVNLETPEQLFRDLKNLGSILDNQVRAEEIIAFYRSRLDRFKREVAEMSDESKPTVLILNYTERGGKAAVKVPAKSWMQTFQTTSVGGRAVWAESSQTTNGWSIVHFEQIAAWNPDKIFIVFWYEVDMADTMASLREDPQWKKLKAVKNNEMYIYPGDIFGWDSPEPRWILGMSWLAGKIHPERFSDIEMNAEIHAFFETLYGLKTDIINKYILPLIHLQP
jgi:iron complex transport system substrate-binding protein